MRKGYPFLRVTFLYIERNEESMNQRVVIDWERFLNEKQRIEKRAEESFRHQLGVETTENKELLKRQYEEGLQWIEKMKQDYLPQGIIVRKERKDYFIFCITKQWEGTLLEQCYHDLWCNAYLLETRREFIKERHIYGPGYDGETLESIKEILDIINPSELPVSFVNNCLWPIKTLIGYGMIDEKREKEKLEKCKQCKGNEKNCNYCID